MSEEPIIPNAGAIIDAFGGIRPMAAKLGVPVTTVQGWKKRDVIPGHRRALIEEAAGKAELDLGEMLEIPAADDPEPTKTTAVPFNAMPAGAAFNVWGTGALLVLALLGGFLLFGPRAQQVEAQNEKIVELQSEIQNLRAERAKAAESVNSAVKENIDLLKTQTQDLQGKISALSSETSTLGKTLADQGQQVAVQIGELEQRVGVVTRSLGSEALRVIPLKLKAWSANTSTASLGEEATRVLSKLVEQTSGAGTEVLQQSLLAAQGGQDALAEILKGIPPENLKAAALLIGLSQFRDALDRDRVPFDHDLVILKHLLGDQDPTILAALDKLSPQAENGVLTARGLRRALANLSEDIVNASLAGEDVSIEDRVAARLHDVIQVEKNGEPVSGTLTQKQLEKAKHLLDQGDIAGTIVELQALEGSARKAADPWIVDAQATLLAGQVRDGLESALAGLVQTTRLSIPTPYTP